MSSALQLAWFARHEIRLAWRDWLSMLTAGRKRRTRNVAIGLMVFAALMHLLAYAVVAPYAQMSSDTVDRTALIVTTVSLFLAWALILSQAMESVTRVLYSRADLDLIMSSPVMLTNVFSTRMGAIAFAVTAMALLLSAPFIDALALAGGPHWLAAYGVIAASGISAAAVAIALTIGLFHLIGAKRTRLVAQVFAVIIGAGFVIAIQIAAILSTNTLSRFALLTSNAVTAVAPEEGSVVWVPVRAALGDGAALLGLLGGSLVLLGITLAVFSPRLGDDVISASTGMASATARGRAFRPFRVASRAKTLRRKELLLLWRDPWLMSQSLMQLLYLIPPAVMLWRSFTDSSAALMLITPVLVMAAGQLAGGLAWLTISGEDAADLVATAPLAASRVTRAKIEVVLIVIAFAFAPLMFGLAVLSVSQAVVTALGIGIAAVSATAIQLWFRVQARRSQFRRRQTSSRLATFAEAFSSIGWAATTALALAIPFAAVITGLLTIGIMAASWKVSPRRD
ncbi:permease [Nitrobacter sp. JJSN]|uniref:permease n=1 Tax=Nitrobacter sp. JJSN TaxID=3453033 RepID=UPI003F76F341